MPIAALLARQLMRPEPILEHSIHPRLPAVTCVTKTLSDAGRSANRDALLGLLDKRRNHIHRLP